MGCACGTKKGEKVNGCDNNGACGTGGCNKMNVFDWLSNMDMPVADKFDVVEVRFKNGRKDFFRNTEKLSLTTGDAIIVETANGHHLGHVSLQGELVRLQMQKKKVANDSEIKKIYRLANQNDLVKLEEVKKRENPTLYRSREIIGQYKLTMKLSDVEYQVDNAKATFFYSAEDRVDFRELIKSLASEFKIRVEMRQISLRQEAGRIGGIGVCGRELCCSTWLSDFKNVTTSAARYQNLSLNPSKLSGQCGRLKCCLNYELDTYMEALKDIPEVEGPLLTERGEATLQKTDIFRKIMWFGFREDNNWYPLNVERVNEILLMNREGKKPATLDNDQIAVKESIAVRNSDLETLDKKFSTKSKKKKKKKNRTGQNNPGTPQAQSGEEAIRQSNPQPPQDGLNPRGNQQRGRQQGASNKNNPQRPQGGGNPNKPGNPQRPQGGQQNKQANPQRQQGNRNQNRPNNPNRPQGPQQNRPPQQPDKPSDSSNSNNPETK
jgi:cell fate regulator YaaT (PSP1 superfamily)